MALTRKQLVDAAEDINTVLDPDPNIDVTKSVDELKAQIKEAAEILEDEDKITAETRAVVDELMGKKTETEANAAPAARRGPAPGTKIPSRAGSFSEAMDNILEEGGTLNEMVASLRKEGKVPEQHSDDKKVRGLLRGHALFREKQTARFEVKRTGEGDDEHFKMTKKESAPVE